MAQSSPKPRLPPRDVTAKREVARERQSHENRHLCPRQHRQTGHREPTRSTPRVRRKVGLAGCPRIRGLRRARRSSGAYRIPRRSAFSSHLIKLPAQPVDATPSNAFIRPYFPGRIGLFGCPRSKPSRWCPADLTVASDLAFVFKASRVRPECCVDLLRSPHLPVKWVSVPLFS